MAFWLFKQEPGCYSFADLQRDGTTLWDGVGNNLAQQNLRKVRKGDRILFYHTGKEKAVVGVMQAASDPKPDPTADDGKRVAVQVKPVQVLARAVRLSEIKADEALADWDLLRLPRLSVLPVSEDQWRRIEELSQESGDA
jgi:predicted RNA-binding protein with PUA-like domain